MYGSSQLKGLVTARQKITKPVKLKNWLFFNTTNFKVMKTIRNQQKYPIGERLPMLFRTDLELPVFNFLCGYKKNNK